MQKRKFEPGHRIMVLTGHLSQDTIDCVGMRGTVIAVYSKDPTGKDRNEFCISVKMDSRIGRDLPALFRASDIASSNPKGK